MKEHISKMEYLDPKQLTNNPHTKKNLRIAIVKRVDTQILEKVNFLKQFSIFKKPLFSY